MTERRPAAAFLDHVAVDRDEAAAIPVQIARRLRDLILAGGLARGARLPSTRRLAAILAVSRTTATAAVDILAAEGFVEARHGSGTYVAAQLPADRLARAASPPGRAQPGPALSRRGEVLAAGSWIASAGHLFTPGLPALDAFPMGDWRRALVRAQRLHGRGLLHQTDRRGWPPLRAAIAAYVGPARGVVCTPDQVVILASARQAVSLAGNLLADPGDSVWVEDPGYPDAHAALRAAGLVPVPVPVDGAGMDVAEGQRLAPAARLAAVTPSHQYPLGAIMSLERRVALLDWARSAGAVIVEDDYDGEFRYGGRPITALYGLDGGDRVLYVGSFSKAMFPSLRLAYLVAPPGLAAAVAEARRAAHAEPPALTQAALAEFVAGEAFTAHIRRMRLLYRARQDALVAAVRRHLDGVLTVAPSEAGMHLVGHLHPDFDDRAVAAAAGRDGMGLTALSRFAVGSRRRNGLVMGYAAHDSALLEDGVRRLARIIDALGSGPEYPS
ncbi:GntR family transcriptional regulator/MocR family aminotransferase [Stella humosa]|uniref:GntR family transcriptional regulator/MocR family aminotransferase n=1 Tax=Stella humosa TaxID=94 RepID=A0A3N1LJP0_9PROT|nr:PLP-dependent aminotransferase family protein [Stella humosa]ROP91029.1 GntR family transcriptional regulator/MocR family aminotransferase [Stella humosa]BBK34621.1 transcriptional regulator [Stella humosa]